MGKIRIEEKLQIDVIKGNRIFYKDYGDLCFLADGHIGAYIPQKDLKIDKAKMIPISAESACFDPEVLNAERVRATITKIAHKIIKGYAIKIKEVEGENYCFVQEQFLKLFDNPTTILIKSKKDPVLIMDDGMWKGIILPINISEEVLN